MTACVCMFVSRWHYMCVCRLRVPAQYLSTELEVDHHDGHLGAGDDEDHKHQEEEAKQVVELILPDGLGGGGGGG